MYKYYNEENVIQNYYASDSSEELYHNFDNAYRASLSNESKKIYFKNEIQNISDEDKDQRRASQSAWSKWSQDRRVLSGKRQINTSTCMKFGSLFDQITHPIRTPTPIMKAREESKHLVAPEIAINYPPLEAQKRKSSCVKGSRRGAISYQIPSTVKLTYNEIQLLTEYWDHTNFLKSRKWGLCIGLLSLGLQIYSICSSIWFYYGKKDFFNQMGLVLKCTSKNKSCSVASSSHIDISNWIKTIIVLTMLGSLCNMLALMFCFCGVFVKHLPKKLYYYHSGAEFYCIASLSNGSSLTIFTIFLKHDFLKFTLNHYGHAYTLGWIGVLFSFIAFFLLKLDEFIQEFYRPCHWKKGVYRLKIPCIKREETFTMSPSTSIITQNWRKIAHINDWS